MAEQSNTAPDGRPNWSYILTVEKKIDALACFSDRTCFASDRGPGPGRNGETD